MQQKKVSQHAVATRLRSLFGETNRGHEHRLSDMSMNKGETTSVASQSANPRRATSPSLFISNFRSSPVFPVRRCSVLSLCVVQTVTALLSFFLTRRYEFSLVDNFFLWY
jgi:hypothetical protein